MVDDKELDEFVEKELKKDLTQEDKIDESVERHLQEMGFLWDRVQRKFHKDKTCFVCKENLELEDGQTLRVVEASKVGEGVVAFVSLCEKCYNKEIGEKENE